MSAAARRLEALEAATWRCEVRRVAESVGMTPEEVRDRVDRLQAQVAAHGWDRAVELLADEVGINAGELRAEIAATRRARAAGAWPG